MAQIPYLSRSSRTGQTDRRGGAAKRRGAALLLAGMALAMVLSAFSWRSPAARADSGGSPSPGGTQANIPSAWTGCSAGTKVADNNPGAVHGLFIAGPNQNNKATGLNAYPVLEPVVPAYLLSDPTICGASLVIPWSTIDKGPSFGAKQYDFSYLDTEAKKWTDHGKIVNVIVWGADESSDNAFGGTVGTDGSITVARGTPSTPAYVRSNTSLKTVSQSSCGKSDSWGTPVYWDSTYRDNWRAFQTALITYLNSTASYAAKIGYIRFGIGAGGEDFPVDQFNDSGCWTAWTAEGLSASQWLKFSKDAIDYEATLGSHNELLVAINSFSAGDTSVPDGVAEEAKDKGMAIGMEGMTSTQMTDCEAGAATYADWCKLFADPSYRGHVPLELQTLTQSSPGAGGDTGYLPPLLDYMVKAGAQVLEIWPQEWLVADDTTWTGNAANPSTYAANSAAYATALQLAACQVGGQAGVLRLGCTPTPPEGFRLP